MSATWSSSASAATRCGCGSIPIAWPGRNITADEVVQALREQNVQVAAGQVGAPPTRAGQTYQISVRAAGRLSEPAEFDDIILKRAADGALVRVKDVGRTELGAESYSQTARYNGRDAVGFGVLQLPTANALAGVSRRHRRRSIGSRKRFPPGLKIEIAFDTTTVVAESIREVVTTLLEAIGLVVLVMFLFLQNWRTTLIPAHHDSGVAHRHVCVRQAVRLLDQHADALRHHARHRPRRRRCDRGDREHRAPHPRATTGSAASRPASDARCSEVTGAVIATALVLAAVFVPVAFFPGTTGRLYQQFALTIAFSMAISAFNALTLTPALAALLLSRVEKPKGLFFRGVNRVHRRRHGSCWSRGCAS